MELADRQARVGIVANPASVTLPRVTPRESIARWPDLRSPRRLRRLGVAKRPRPDPDVTADALGQFANEVRQKRSWLGGVWAYLRQST